MFALGNELSGDFDVMKEFLDHFRSIDSRHLLAYGSNNYLGFRGQHLAKIIMLPAVLELIRIPHTELIYVVHSHLQMLTTEVILTAVIPLQILTIQEPLQNAMFLLLALRLVSIRSILIILRLKNIPVL